MPSSFRTLLLALGVGFCAGIAFQKWIAVGTVVARLEKTILHPAIRPDPALQDSSTFSILSLGQSNVANHGESRGSAGPSVYCLHAGSFSQAIDPLPGASGNGGSVWTRLAPLLLRKPGISSVVISSVAQSGSGIDTWLPAGVNHPRATAAIQDFKDKSLQIDAVVWHQGETEAWGNSTLEESYRRQLEGVIASLRAEGITAPVYVCQTSRDLAGVSNSAIRLAQSSVWNSELRIYAGADTDSLGPDFRWDGIHLNDAGLEKFSEILETAMDSKSTSNASRLPQ